MKKEAYEVYARFVAQVPRLGRAHYLMGLFRRRHVNELDDVEQA